MTVDSARAVDLRDKAISGLLVSCNRLVLMPIKMYTQKEKKENMYFLDTNVFEASKPILWCLNVLYGFGNLFKTCNLSAVATLFPDQQTNYKF